MIGDLITGIEHDTDKTFEEIVIERLDILEMQVTEILEFVHLADQTFKKMAEAIEGNPMLKMMMG